MTKMLAVLLICCAPSAAFAQALPTLNIEPGCKAAASNADGALTSIESCRQDEQSARDELSKRWAEFPSGDRQQCLAEVSGFEPSYVELLECVTMAGEARKMDQGEKPAPTARSSRKAKK